MASSKDGCAARGSGFSPILAASIEMSETESLEELFHEMEVDDHGDELDQYRDTRKSQTKFGVAFNSSKIGTHKMHKLFPQLDVAAMKIEKDNSGFPLDASNEDMLDTLFDNLQVHPKPDVSLLSKEVPCDVQSNCEEFIRILQIVCDNVKFDWSTLQSQVSSYYALGAFIARHRPFNGRDNVLVRECMTALRIYGEIVDRYMIHGGDKDALHRALTEYWRCVLVMCTKSLSESSSVCYLGDIICNGMIDLKFLVHDCGEDKTLHVKPDILTSVVQEIYKKSRDGQRNIIEKIHQKPAFVCEVKSTLITKPHEPEKLPLKKSDMRDVPKRDQIDHEQDAIRHIRTHHALQLIGILKAGSRAFNMLGDICDKTVKIYGMCLVMHKLFFTCLLYENNSAESKDGEYGVDVMNFLDSVGCKPSGYRRKGKLKLMCTPYLDIFNPAQMRVALTFINYITWTEQKDSLLDIFTLRHSCYSL